jgi:hypothetical protein
MDPQSRTWGHLERSQVRTRLGRLMLALGLVAVLGGCGADGAGNARDSSSAARVRPGQEPAPPPTPGTYKYRQTGTITMSGKTRSVPETGRFVLDRARGEPSGARTQVWHSYLDARENPSDVTLQFRPDAIALVQQTQRIINAGQTFVFTCKFKEPLAALPWPLVVGYRYSGKGGCGPLFKVSVAGRVTDTRQVDLDGAPHTVYEIVSRVTTTGQLDATVTLTDWFSPALRLQVREDIDMRGTYAKSPIVYRSTRDLVSGIPS